MKKTLMLLLAPVCLLVAGETTPAEVKTVPRVSDAHGQRLRAIQAEKTLVQVRFLDPLENEWAQTIRAICSSAGIGDVSKCDVDRLLRTGEIAPKAEPTSPKEK